MELMSMKAMLNEPTDLLVPIFKTAIKEWNQRQSYFGVHDIEGIRYLTQLRVKFSNLREHRFGHNFHCLSPHCICGNGEENNQHFLLHCPWYVDLDEVSNLVGAGIFELSSNDLCTLLLCGNDQFNTVTNRAITEATVQFIQDQKT